MDSLCAKVVKKAKIQTRNCQLDTHDYNGRSGAAH